MVSLEEVIDPEYLFTEELNLEMLFEVILASSRDHMGEHFLNRQDKEALSVITDRFEDAITDILHFIEESSDSTTKMFIEFMISELVRCSFLIGRRVRPSKSAHRVLVEENTREARRKKSRNSGDEVMTDYIIDQEIARMFSKWDGKKPYSLAGMIARSLTNKKKVNIKTRTIYNRTRFKECLGSHREGQRSFKVVMPVYWDDFKKKKPVGKTR